MIRFFDITRQNKLLEKELNKAIWEVINKGNYILGEKVGEFEREFAKYLGGKFAVGVASGTDALSLSLLAIGVTRGDEVILPANAYPTVFAVAAIGAVPRLVDIDPITFNINPDKIPQALTKKTKAIIPVHLYGQPANMRKILEIGKKYQVPIIEDCCQAHGSSIKYYVSGITYKKEKKGKIPNTKYEIRNTEEKKVGSIGDVGCFSFYPTKNLGCFGDGGMVVTNNEEIYKKVKLLRMYGEERRYNSILLGRNSRLDELQAAILLVKLKYLDKWNEKRRKMAELYSSQLAGPAACVSQGDASSRPFMSGSPFGEASLGSPSLASPAIICPFETLYVKHVNHLFVIRTNKRDELKKYFEEKGIQTAIHYPVPIHMVPSMKFLDYKKGDFPESEKACEEILSLPMYPELKDKEVKRVVDEIGLFYSK